MCIAVVAQLVEHFHGKEKVASSILANGSLSTKCMKLKQYTVWLLTSVVVIVCSTLYLYYWYTSEKDIQQSEVSNQPQVLESKEKDALPLLFVGDIMLGRYVETLMKVNGSGYPFGKLDDLFKSHVTIANLEGPIPEKHVQTKVQGFQFSFPTSTPALLKAHGIRAVSLANNHSMDWGLAGYMHTKKVLDEMDVAHFGAYNKTTEDYFETKIGTTTAIIYGINAVSNTWDEAAALSVTKKLHSEHPESYLIAYIHWGEEYNQTQKEVQRTLAHKLINNGVDIIVGSHPHVTQGVETYKTGIIFYSLGNYIFDQYFSKETQEGYVLSVIKKDGGIFFTLLPVISVRSHALLATSTRATEILTTIAKNSSVEIRNQILTTGKIQFRK